MIRTVPTRPELTLQLPLASGVVRGTWLPVVAPTRTLEHKLRVYWVGPCPWCQLQCFVGHMPTRPNIIDPSFALLVGDAVLRGEDVVFVTAVHGDAVSVEDLETGLTMMSARADVQPVVPFGLHVRPECPGFHTAFKELGFRAFLAQCRGHLNG